MRRLPALAACLLVLGLPATSRSDIRLAWNECGAAGTTDLAFACSDIHALHVLVPSFDAPPGVTQFVGTESVISFAGDLSGLTEWWQFAPGECRSGLLSTVNPGVIGYEGCASPYPPFSDILSLTTYEPDPLGRPNRRLLTSIVATPGKPEGLNAGQEYMATAIQIRSTRTDVCSGCAAPVCLTLQRVAVYDVSGLVVELTGPAVATWQGGTIDDPTSECRPVRTRKETWGGIKSLYR